MYSPNDTPGDLLSIYKTRVRFCLGSFVAIPQIGSFDLACRVGIGINVGCVALVLNNNSNTRINYYKPRSPDSTRTYCGLSCSIELDRILPDGSGWPWFITGGGRDIILLSRSRSNSNICTETNLALPLPSMVVARETVSRVYKRKSRVSWKQ